MFAAYGVDVLDPAVSTRRVHVLLQRLPPSARRPGEDWSVEAELLAQLIDHIAELTWVTLKAHGAKNATKPRPVKRPPPRNRPRPPQRPPAPVAGAGDGGTWLDAAKALAVMPGVRVIDDG